jgi:hypothetical protein
MGKRARGGTRTGFLPLRTLGSLGNKRNPHGSDPHTTRSEAHSLYIFNTPISLHRSFQTNDRTYTEGTRFFFELTRTECWKFSPTFVSAPLPSP